MYGIRSCTLDQNDCVLNPKSSIAISKTGSVCFVELCHAVACNISSQVCQTPKFGLCNPTNFLTVFIVLGGDCPRKPNPSIYKMEPAEIYC
jgi:hypothetical protein